MRSVASAAAVSVGIAPNHVESRNDLHARWSYVHACSNSSASARAQIALPSDHGYSGRITTPRRTRRTLPTRVIASACSSGDEDRRAAPWGGYRCLRRGPSFVGLEPVVVGAERVEIVEPSLVALVPLVPVVVLEA